MMSDAEKYRTFWTEFGRVVKEGLVSDPDNRDAILDLVSFPSTHDPERLTTLREYVERMKPGQQDVYCATGESRTVIESSPHLEAFRDKGYEVLFLTDPVDEMWLDRVREFDGKALTSIGKGDVDLDTDEEKAAAEADRERQRADYAGLLGWLTTTLADDVKEVRLSARLTTSPACIVGDTNDLTPTLERMYRAMGQDLPKVKRILELNPTHPLVTGLRQAHADKPDDPELADTARLLHGMALLAEGGDLGDPAGFVRLLAQRLARTL
jgi:molecular chaperone HtpG